MQKYTMVRTEHLDQSMATQIEGNIDAVSKEELQQAAPTGQTISSIKNEIARGEIALLSYTPQHPLFISTKDGIKLNSDHAITLAYEAVQLFINRFIIVPIAGWLGQTSSDEISDSLPPATEPELLPPVSAPPKKAPQPTHRYNLEVVCPPETHATYLPGLVSLANVPDKEESVYLSENTKQKEHYWLKGMATSDDSRKLYYKPQAGACSNLFSFEVSLVESSSEVANEALIPVTPTVQIGKRLGLPTKGYFYHFYNKKLIQEFKIKEDSSCFQVTQSYGDMLTDDVKIQKLQNHILLYWRIHGKVVDDQHILYREEKLTKEELSKAGAGKWLDDNAVTFNPSKAIEKLNEKEDNKSSSYTVKKGDYLSKIAKKAGTTVSAIQKLNPDITDPSRIDVGQVINIPPKSKKKIKTAPNLPAEEPAVIHRQENIHYEYPFPNVGQHILAIKEKTIDSNLIAINVANLTKPRRLSEKGRDLLKSVEELRLKPYDDSDPNTILQKHTDGATIGYGHLIRSSEWKRFKNGLSKKQCESLLSNDLKDFEVSADENLEYHVSQQQFDAVVIFAYNVGAGKLSTASFVRLINNSEAQTPYKSIDEGWLAYSKVTKRDKNGDPVVDPVTHKKVKIVLRGLLNRRQCELNIYHNGVYERW